MYFDSFHFRLNSIKGSNNLVLYRFMFLYYFPLVNQWRCQSEGCFLIVAKTILSDNCTKRFCALSFVVKVSKYMCFLDCSCLNHQRHISRFYLILANAIRKCQIHVAEIIFTATLVVKVTPERSILLPRATPIA